jgi:hypothetical protein
MALEDEAARPAEIQNDYEELQQDLLSLLGTSVRKIVSTTETNLKFSRSAQWGAKSFCENLFHNE